MDVLARVVARARGDPDWFSINVLRSPNDPWQSEGMQAVADLDRLRRGESPQVNPDGRRRFSVVSGHGTGKTHWCAKMMHWWNFTRRGLIPCTAPKEGNLANRLWPEFRRITAGALPEYRRLIKADRLRITWGGDPDWCALVETAAQPENLAGYHAAHLLFLVEEASGVPELMFPVIEGALSTEDAVLIMIGNGVRNEGTFYDSHAKESTRRKFWTRKVGYLDSPRVSRQWALDMIERYGEGSPVVKVRVLGEFADTEADQLIPLSWLSGALGREWEPDGTHPHTRVTVDVADGGVDFTVVTVAKMFGSLTVFEAQETFNFPPSESPILAADAAERIYRSWGADSVVVDALGVGAGTAGELMRRGLNVIAYKGGAASDDPGRWRNRRAESYMVLRDQLRDGKVAFAEGFPAWDHLCAEVCSVRTRPGQERVEELETKESMRRRGVKSPDRADGLAMCFMDHRPAVPAGVFTPMLVGEELASLDYDDVGEPLMPGWADW